MIVLDAFGLLGVFGSMGSGATRGGTHGLLDIAIAINIATGQIMCAHVKYSICLGYDMCTQPA